MKAKLSHKFFLAILVYSLVIVGLIIGAVQFFAYRNFSDYITRVELDELNGLTQFLVALYQEDGGWNSLRSAPESFKEILRRTFPNEQPKPDSRRRYSDNQRRPRDERRDHDRPPRSDRRPPPPNSETRRDSEGRERRPPRREEERRNPQNVRLKQPGESPPEISRRLSLFDENKKLLFGNSKLSEQVLRPIETERGTVGWLGIKKQENLTHPLDRKFIKQQTKAFYLIGIAILFLGALLSTFLSGLLVRPIRRLIHAAGQLAFLKFETRIELNRKDELGQLAETFNSMAQTLKHYETARRQWLSDVAHELRTPLSVLQVEIESMQDGVKEADGEALESLRAEVLHLGRIVEDLHELSLADSKTLKMNKTRINAVWVLRETLEKYSEMLEREGLSLIDELGDGGAGVALADRDRLIQVFSNLIKNSIRYVDKPGALKVGRIDRKRRLLLYFEDSGPGVPNGAMERLFERFFRVDTSRNREKGGSGLGLAICKNIVEAHGGTITAMKSSLGGLRIEISLPTV